VTAADTAVAIRLPDPPDPAAAFAAFAPAGHRFWLDAGPGADSGWSWVGMGVPESPTTVHALPAAAAARADAPSGPFPLGWVGWVGYEAGVRRLGMTRRPGGEPMPPERWLRVTGMVAFDHVAGRAWMLAGSESEAAHATALLRKPRVGRSVPISCPQLPEATADGAGGTVRARTDPRGYRDRIGAAQEAIAAGDAYQLCLTTRFTVTGAVDPVAAHRSLRILSPSPRGAIILSGAHGIVSSSPEQFLDIRGGVVRTRPIKGTSARSDDPVADAALATALRHSPKERAENAMIVDLVRNDLTRVCEPGTVSVEDLLTVESYRTVHQLVSGVAGVIRTGVTIGAVLDAAFPAGSMTGAPKISAIGLLAALEDGPRGVFGGCYGWVGRDGSADLAMTIRTLATHPRGAYVGAGGGITALSDPAAEVREVALKAAPVLAAAGADLPQEWRDRVPLP
jgi:anthranilate synthase component 1